MKMTSKITGWLGRGKAVERKASAAAFTVQLGKNQPQFTPRRYDRLADEGYDRNAIEALAPRRDIIWQRVKDADFMTVNEKRAALGLSELAHSDADQL